MMSEGDIQARLDNNPLTVMPSDWLQMPINQTLLMLTFEI